MSRSLVLLLLLLPLLLLIGCGGTETVKKEIVVRVGSGDFDPVQIYKRAAPAVVTVVPAKKGQALGQGSGFLMRNGIVATNAHVALQESGKPYGEFYLNWQSGDRTSAKLLIADPDTDLALLQTGPPAKVAPLSLSPRQNIFPGEFVAAIGSPFGEPQSLSTGTVSAVGRSIQSLNRFQISNAIQTDASINPGNSGGPLLDSSGKVIGINQQIQTSSGGNDGVGYAVPAADLQRLVSFALRGKQPEDAYLGVSTQDVWPQLAERLGIPENSLLIAEVVSGGPGDRAGLRGGKREFFFQGSPVIAGGDAILEIGNLPAGDPESLSTALRRSSPGDRVRIIFWRDGKKRSADLVLGQRPE